MKDEAWSFLRELLSEEPSVSSWTQLLYFLEELEKEDLKSMIPYVAEHIEPWPDALKVGTFFPTHAPRASLLPSYSRFLGSFVSTCWIQDDIFSGDEEFFLYWSDEGLRYEWNLSRCCTYADECFHFEEGQFSVLDERMIQLHPETHRTERNLSIATSRFSPINREDFPFSLSFEQTKEGLFLPERFFFYTPSPTQLDWRLEQDGYETYRFVVENGEFTFSFYPISSDSLECR